MLTLTIIVPVYNEEQCLEALLDRLQTLRLKLAERADVDFLFVDDGSSDDSFSLLRNLAERHSHLRLISLSRNFGHQIAVTAGIDHVDSDYVAVIDADLQDPPEAIAPMLDQALLGYDVVFGLRRSREGETRFKKYTAAGFYRLLGYLAEIDIPRNAGDFRLMSRRVVEALQQMREQHRFIRGMVPWVGFQSTSYLYDREERYAGETKYSLPKMIRFATNAILSFSVKPIVLATKAGLVTVLAGLAGGAYMLYLKLFTDVPVAGLTAILLSILIMGGAQILLIGMVGQYVARIFEESKRRPLYIVEETRNL